MEFHLIEQGGTEGITKKRIVEMFDITPKAVMAVTAFRDKAVDMWVRFQVPAKSMKDHDKTRSEIHGFIVLEEPIRNDTCNRMKKAVKEGHEGRNEGVFHQW